jgi:hypothetical protein
MGGGNFAISGMGAMSNMPTAGNQMQQNNSFDFIGSAIKSEIPGGLNGANAMRPQGMNQQPIGMMNNSSNMNGNAMGGYPSNQGNGMHRYSSW